MTAEVDPENTIRPSNYLRDGERILREIETLTPAERERLIPRFLQKEEKKQGLWARLRGL